ncbi:RNA polymerase sigma factor [Planctomycetota bacterium]
MTEKKTDIRLLKQAVQGNRPAFGELYARYADTVYNYALWFAGAAQVAEDIVQEVFLHLLSRPDSYRGTGSLKSYLLQIARHRMLNLKRDRAVEKKALQHLQELQFFRSQPSDAAQERTGQINRTLQALPFEKREAVALRLFEGMTFEAIGKLIQCPARTVESRYYSALKQLKDITHG